MHQSSSTTKRQKEESTSTNKSTLFKIITTKLLKVKDENGKVIADKKRRFNS
jgi:hypothetical protein